MSTRTEEHTESRPAAAPLLGRRDVVPAIVALVAGIAVGALAWGTFGWDNVLGVILVSYLAFVATLALAESLRARPEEQLVDLVAEEAVDQAGGVESIPPEVSRAHLVAVPDDADNWSPETDRPVKRSSFRGSDLAEGVAAAVAGLAVAELVRIVIRMQSLVGFSIWWYLASLTVYFFLIRDRSDVEAAIDRIVSVVVWTIGMLTAGVLFWMVGFVVAKGVHGLSVTFFTEDLSKVGPLSPGGGAKHTIIGTLEQVGIATVIVVPIAVMTAVYLNEINGRLAKPIRFITDALSGLPSIVAGLLIFTIIVQSYGFSGIAAALALAVLMLPVVTRTSEEILRTVPDSLREGSLALGAPRWRLVQRVVLPTALTGLVTAVILGVARAIGETAPMLLTAFGSDSTVTRPNDGPQDDLPLFVWKLIRSPVDAQVQRVWTGALVLVMLVFALFVLARLIAGRGERRLRRAR